MHQVDQVIPFSNSVQLSILDTLDKLGQTSLDWIVVGFGIGIRLGGGDVRERGET